MEMREFTRRDWDAFAGAERWPDAAPLIGEGAFADGERYVLVLDATGGCMIADDEQADYGGYQLRRAFLSQAEARAFAERLGNPDHKLDLFVRGFRKV